MSSASKTLPRGHDVDMHVWDLVGMYGISWVLSVHSSGWTVRGSNSGGGGENLHIPPDRPWGPIGLLCSGHRVPVPEVKRPGRGVDYPPKSSAEVTERVELYLYPLSGPSRPVVNCTGVLKLLENCFSDYKDGHRNGGQRKNRDLCWNRDTVTVEFGSISVGLWSLFPFTRWNGDKWILWRQLRTMPLLSANPRLNSRDVLTHFTLTARNIMRRVFPHCHTSAFCGTCSTLHCVRFLNT